MNRHSVSHSFKLILALATLALLLNRGCVESLNEVHSAPPIIKIYSPSSGDSIQVGKNEITYMASDNPNGAGIDHYDIVINNFESVKVIGQNEDGSNPPLYLEVDTSYLFKRLDYFVIVYTKGGNTARSAEMTGLFVAKSVRPPVKPYNLILSRITPRSVNLVWDDSSANENGFELWRKDGPEGSYRLHKTLPENSISTDDIDLLSGLVYYYKVRAFNEFGYSDFSNEAFTDDVVSGNTPTDLTGEPLGATKVYLKWTDNATDELGFKIERLDPQGTAFNLIGTALRNATEYTDEGLTANSLYKYRVAAYSSSSQSDWSNVAEVKTANNDIPAPGNLKANFDYNSRIVMITWSDNTNLENGTVVERRTGESGSFQEIGFVGTDINIFYDTTFNYNSVYYYRAKHSTSEGYYTPYSNIDSVSIPNLPPGTPTQLSVFEFTPGILYGLTWNDNAFDEDGFELHRKISESGTYIVHRILPANSIAYNDTVPLPNVTYYYKIRSFRGSDFSPFSNEVNTSGGSSGTGLAKPTNLYAHVVSGKLEIELGWDDNSVNEFGYEIERRLTGSSGFSRIGVAPPDAVTYLDIGPGLFRGSSYDYRVRAYDSGGYSEYSNVVTVVIPF